MRLSQHRDKEQQWRYGTLLSRLSPVVRTALLALGAQRRAPAGERLLRQGARDTHVILLREGFAKVSCVTSDGYEALLAIRAAGDLVGEFAALNSRPRSATVTACTPCRVSVIHRPELHAFLVTYPEAAMALAGMVADRLRSANEYRVDFASYPIRIRLARVLVKLATSYGRRTAGGLAVEASQPELASLCGAAEVTAQKTLRAFRQENLIVTGYRCVIVTDLAGLRVIAELDPSPED